ncbi:MAG TPA: hypothetical protein VI756_17395, partial [Blastocatellia bacterium]
NYTLPVKTQASGAPPAWITITTNSSALPGSGSRVSPADAVNMGGIFSPNASGAIQTAPQSAYYKIVGVEIGPAPGSQSNDGILLLGDGSNDQNSLDLVPHHFIVDRCYIHGAAMSSCKRGIGLNCASATIENSYVSEFHAVGVDSQAICGWNGPGPFKIVNNYLEGASENVLFGGSDPSIPNLIPSGIKFEQNYVSKPISWMSPILPTVTGVTATPQSTAQSMTGASLVPGTTYYYSVAANASIAGTGISSSGSAETTVALSNGQNAISLSWQPVAGAQGYQVYRTTDPPTSTTQNWSAYSTSSTTFVDTGASSNSTGSGPPSPGDTWGIKNLFELKNAHDALVNGNIFENSWVDAQTGFAISLKSVDQDGTAPWSSTTDVAFTNNIVRNAAGGINTLGLDPDNPSAQACCMTIENNLFYNINGPLYGGGSGDFLQIGELVNFSVSRNTVIQTGNTISVYGTNTTGFAFNKNITPLNQYGIKGSSEASGSATIQSYFPGGILQDNVLVGGANPPYPKQNFFPASISNVGFVDPANSNYELATSSPYAPAATNGLSLGANVAAIMKLTANIQGPYQATSP